MPNGRSRSRNCLGRTSSLICSRTWMRCSMGCIERAAETCPNWMIRVCSMSQEVFCLSSTQDSPTTRKSIPSLLQTSESSINSQANKRHTTHLQTAGASAEGSILKSRPPTTCFPLSRLASTTIAHHSSNEAAGLTLTPSITLFSRTIPSSEWAIQT